MSVKTSEVELAWRHCRGSRVGEGSGQVEMGRETRAPPQSWGAGGAPHAPLWSQPISLLSQSSPDGAGKRHLHPVTRGN